MDLHGKKVLVIGAGIAGPAAAILLQRRGCDVDIVERAPEFRNIGFGITIWPNGHRILEEIGIGAQVKTDGHVVPWVDTADDTGHLLGRRLDFSGFAKYGEPVKVVERSALHGLLISKVREAGLKPRLGVSVSNLIDDGRQAHVEFSDGSAGAYDLVVAADGIRSDMRERLFGRHNFRFYGWAVRLFWVPPAVPVPRGIVILSKERRTLAIYPMHGKAFATFYEYNPRRREGADSAFSFEEFLPYLEKHGWDKDHIHALEKEALDNHQYYDHLRHVLPGPWHKGRVALIGDARHGFSPIIGMGANMALEDAWVLVEELAQSPDVPQALRDFGVRRKARLRSVSNATAFAGRWYMIRSRPMRSLRNLALRIFPKEVFLVLIESILKRQP